MVAKTEENEREVPPWPWPPYAPIASSRISAAGQRHSYHFATSRALGGKDTRLRGVGPSDCVAAGRNRDRFSRTTPSHPRSTSGDAFFGTHARVSGGGTGRRSRVRCGYGGRTGVPGGSSGGGSAVAKTKRLGCCYKRPAKELEEARRQSALMAISPHRNFGIAL